MSERLQLRLGSNLDALPELDQAIERFGTEREWSQDLLYQVRLALEELTMNIVSHSKSASEIEVSIASSDDSLVIEIADDAEEFNPLEVAAFKDQGAGLEERTIGGLGVHLVRTLMDDVTYSRDEGRNRLVLTKKR